MSKLLLLFLPEGLELGCVNDSENRSRKGVLCFWCLWKQKYVVSNELG